LLFNVQLRLACREFVGKLLSLSSVIFLQLNEVFLLCYFRITRRSMLRSQDELSRCA